MRRWKIAGINFDHMHMGDLLRMASQHPQAEIVALCDENLSRMQKARENFKIPAERIFTDYRACMEQTRPDLVVLCPATGLHGEWTEKIAPFGSHILIEKPFAASLAEADRMISAIAKTGKQLAINWPLRWYASHATAKRLIDEGLIGEVTHVHYYDGNRGPLRHLADKIEISEEDANREKSKSWFYQRQAGGGSLLDYLGYGTTLGTWFMSNRVPLEVTGVIDRPPGLEVDEHSITIARYATGLSKFETRWGTFTDPWILQPQPKCGFVLAGRNGTIASYDYEKTIRVQTHEKPEGYDVAADELMAPFSNPIEYFLHCIETGKAIDGPLSPAVARIGQQIVDTAYLSSQQGKTLPLLS